MWKKRMVCAVLALCALVLTGCQQREVFDTLPPVTVTDPPAADTGAADTETADAAAEEQNLFGDTEVGTTDFDDGSYDPASEEGGDWEPVDEPETESASAESAQAAQTAAPTMQSDYAGATPVLIDPIDKPTPTPLPPLTFTYETYTASALHMTFEAPANWVPDESEADTYRLTNPDPSMDYAATLTIRAIPVNKQYSKSELTKEVKGMLDTLSASGEYSRFEPSNTADRTFLSNTGVYANYKAVLNDGTLIAGRMIVTCVNKTLYTLHVSYPRGYTEFYVENVYDKFRHSVKLT